MPTGYCTKCKANVEIDGGEEFVSKGKNKRSGIKGSCPTCGSSVIHWVSKYNQIEDESQGAPEEEGEILSKDPIPSTPDPSGEISIDELQEVPPETPAPQPATAPPQVPKEEEEKKEEEEEGSDWMEWIPVIVVVLGVAFLFIGAWLLWSNSKKKEEIKAEAEKKAKQTQAYPPGTDILPEEI